MPYKNIEDKRACWNRWYKRHRKTKRKNGRIQAKAKYYHPKREVCNIKDCSDLGERHHPDYTQPKDILWLCKKHHEQIHHADKKLCSLNNCNERHWAKGLCNKHYHKFKRGTL